MHKLVFFQIIVLTLIVSACARLDPAVRKSNANKFAVESGFSIKSIQTQKFSIWAAAKTVKPHGLLETLLVYIEGDGLAYKKRNRPTNDPTPIDYFTLQLAAKDPAESIVYLARPCQFLSKNELKQCEQKFWTSHRYSEEVVISYMEVLDQLKQRYENNNFVLIGYSGGGNIAAHLAARRSDVAKLITVAANLDLDAWTDYHRLPEMSYSLNPAENSQLKYVEQIHFVGEKDEIVPPLVTQAYLDKLSRPDSTELIIKPDFDHHCCWREQWHGAEKLFAD